MCGIYAFVSEERLDEKFIVNKLKIMEYRGYDSFGYLLALKDAAPVQIKSTAPLGSENKDVNYTGNIGIAHTRWATHGSVSLTNAHPHSSKDGLFKICHNGVVENYHELKNRLEIKGYEFKTTTDTEVIANLIHFYSQVHRLGIKEVFEKLYGVLEGDNSFVMVSKNYQNQIFAFSGGSSIVFSKTDGLIEITSDPLALEYNNDDYFLIPKGSMININLTDKVASSIESLEEGKPLNIISYKKIRSEHLDSHEDTYMLAEMKAAPKAIANATSISYREARELISKASRVVFTGCGSAFHSANIGAHFSNKLLHTNIIALPADEAEEFIDFSDSCLVIAVSQSGETHDTLKLVRKAKSKGSNILAITNVKSSALAREADLCLHQNAGAEISVLSTKAVLSQVSLFYCLSGRKISPLNVLVNDWSRVISSEYFKNKIKALTEKSKGLDNWFFIGRGLHKVVAQESALKLKEITYIHAEAIGAGEFKHGPLSLIDERFASLFFLPSKTEKPELFKATIAAAEEIKSRGGLIFAICNNDDLSISSIFDESIILPDYNNEINCLLQLTVGQYLAYSIASQLGRNIDKPRHLAKSVTVR